MTFLDYFVCGVIRNVCLPFCIGKKREPVDPADCCNAMIVMPLTIAMCGRVLGWW